MTDSPLLTRIAFHIGPIPITTTVLTTWAIMAVLALVFILLTRRLKTSPGRAQAVLELVCTAIDQQISATLQSSPAPFRSLIGTLFIFILCANWASAVPGLEPPTAHLETDAALASIVFVATIYFGLRANGFLGYLKTFAEPSWVMIPLNLVEQITRTFSLMVRLFGNVMSGVFIIAIILSLAGLIVPIPLVALDLLTGAVQAYIFAVLATVFIAAAVGEGRRQEANTSNLKEDS